MTSKKLKHTHIHAPCRDGKKRPVGKELAALSLALPLLGCSKEKAFTITIPVKKAKPMIVENEDGTETVVGLKESMSPFKQQDIEISAFDIAQAAAILLLIRYSRMERPKDGKKKE